MGCTRASVLLFRDTNTTQDPINESSGSPSSRKERQSGDGNVKPANGDALPSKELETNDTTLPDAPPQEPTVKAPKPSDVPEVPGDIEMKEAGNVEPDDQNDRAEATRQPSTTQPEGQDGTQMEKSVETPQEPQPSDAQPQETQSPVESTKPASKKQRKSRSPPQAEDPPSKGTEKDAAAAKEIQASAQLPKENKKTQRSREPSVNGGASPGQGTEKPRREDGTRSKARDSQASVSRGKRSGSRPLSSGKKNHEVQARSDPEPEQPQIPEPEADQASNPRRGRPARNDKKLAEPESSTTTERPEPAVDTQLDKDAVPPKSRGRPAKKDNKSAEPEPTTEPEAAEAQLEKDAGPSKSRGRPAKKDKKPAEPESNTRTEQPKEDSAPPKASRGRPGRKYKTSDSAEQPEAQPDPQPDPAAESSKSHRAKDGKRKKRTREPEAEAPPPEEQPASESAPQPEPEQPEEEQDPGESRPQQKGSNKRGRKSKKTATSETTTPEEPTPTEEAADSQPARERRKPREPRGETVPVTVHRLANSSALGMMYTSGVSEDENEDSADELSTRQKTKLPKRGGVNPADVLGQICRETLEKTLTALKNGIENESNTQRRAEWTRKRKAVEAFGSELDGRLLDLSEMLDSNFVLGVQLKKEKRDMIDLRTHLYKVRKEREAIALQMDAVRAKHMEEEAAKTVSSPFYEAWLSCIIC